MIGVDLLREDALVELISEFMSEVDDEFFRFGGVDKLPTAELCELEMRPSEEELTVDEDLLILIPMFPTIALNDEECRLPRFWLLSVTSSVVFPLFSVSAVDAVLFVVLPPLFSGEEL